MMFFAILGAATLLWTPVLSQPAILSKQREYTVNDINRDLIKHEPTYLVLASKMVRPGQVYRVSVTIYRSPLPITVRAAIQRNGAELASASQECTEGSPETLLLKVPPTSIPGQYKLRVEGNLNGILGGVAFQNETDLDFSQRSMTIFIQTDRPVYMQGQTVRFRAIPITTDLKAFSDAIDVYMLDPRGTIMRRWLSRQSNLGAVSLEYPLSLHPLFGNWTVQVIAQGQVEEKVFEVEEYYQTRFEVNVTMPAFFMNTDQYIYGTVIANYTSGAPVTGNLTIRATVETLTPVYSTQFRKNAKLEQTLKIYTGFAKFRFPMRELQRLLPQLDKTKVTVTAFVGERYLDLIYSGYAQAIIYSSSVKLQFLGSSPQVFKPAMPYKAYAAVSFHDGSPLPTKRLETGHVRFRPVVHFHNSGQRVLEDPQEQMVTQKAPSPQGIWEVTIDLRSKLGSKQLLKDVKSVELEAVYYDDEGTRAKTELIIYASYSPYNRHIQISTSTKRPKVGEYIIFHVRSDYFVERFMYVVLSKGIILLTGEEEMTSSIKTFAVTLSPEMAPMATVVIYDIAREGEVVADSLTFPVDGISRNNFTVTLNERKDRTGDTVEVVVMGQPGTYIGIYGLERSVFYMQPRSDLSQTEVVKKMNSFDEAINGTLMHVWRSREGGPDTYLHFPSASYGIDANRTFSYVGLVVFTDANVTRRHDSCNRTLGYLSCLDGTCYKIEEHCDGHKNCLDGTDESGCPRRELIDIEKFHLNRTNHLLLHYESSWLWRDINIGSLGYFIFSVPVQSIPTTWMVSAFGMSTQHGFGIQRNAIEFSSVKPFFINVEVPTKCILGEQIGVRITIFNYMHIEIEVLVILANSPEYKFVHVEKYGEVVAYNPRTSFGEHQHLIFIRPGKTAEVYMPVVPIVLGDVNITILAKTQVAKGLVTKTIRVEPGGVPQYTHTSIVLDLSQGAYLIKYLDTNVTQTPILPLYQERLYVFSSNKAVVTVVGDVIGPTFPTMPVNATSMLRKPFWSAEQNMFSFAANLYMLLYLRLTGQRQSEAEKQAFRYLNIGYQRQLSYQREDGSFGAFRWHTEPSVWLTAFCARIFHKATFQEWENFLYIDPEVISKAIEWLLDHQTRDGAFYETISQPYDRKINSNFSYLANGRNNHNISLTAHVLITLAEVKDLRGEVGARAASARSAAQRFLERMLHVKKDEHDRDPYELAILAYALTLVNSVDSEEAFNLLDSEMREISGMRYWGKEPVPAPKTTIENNRPYLLPRLPNKYDASNIETTAYGLLVHVARQAVIQKEIVEWLNTQRLSDGGWASTQDSIVALQALIEYAVQSRLRDVTDISIDIDAPSSPGFPRKIHIGEENLSKLHSIEIPNAWGAIIVKAQGSGAAIVQLSVQYGVDWPQFQIPPPVKSFSLTVHGRDFGRNSSHIMFRACQSWLYTQESGNSGMAVLEADIPTGYVVQQQDLNDYVNSRQVKNLKEARFQERKVFFYFDYLGTEKTCITFTVQRWYPVANLTRFMPFRVYDYYAPERYNETMLDVYNLYSLSICHVCGSYQCPYCPIFSSTTTIQSGLLMIILGIIIALSRTFSSH